MAIFYIKNKNNWVINGDQIGICNFYKIVSTSDL